MPIYSNYIAILSILAVLVCPSLCRSAEDFSTVKKALEGMKIDSIRYVDGLEMYEVVTNTQAAYLTKDLRYFIVGRVFDLSTKRDLTTERINSLRHIDFSTLNLKNAIKMGTGKTSIAVFTDPDCGYCKKLHGELSKLKDVTVYIYLYPLASSNSEAKTKSAAIRCANDSLSAMNTVFLGKKPFKPAGKPTAACMTIIEENIRFGKERGINATPTVILEDGRVVPGYKSASDLTAIINKKEAKQ
ncbi:MAG: DsbC family protein [Syntrophales bacterium]|jgi:thiol:disulfide interchange protein DsbC|nr:DsbC family protein [Syntrophales bacterium]